MKILVLDYGAFALDFCLRCRDDGHAVKWAVTERDRTREIGKGLIDIVRDWRPWLRWADLILCPDNTRYLDTLADVRKTYPEIAVIAATPASARLELNREEGSRVLRKHGIPTLDEHRFTDYDKAIAFVKKEGRRFVSKPCGDETDKSLTYVSKSPADLVYMLERWRRGHRHKDAFILQEFVSGVEMAVGAWIGPAGFVDGWCENFEFKKLMVGDLGVATGEQGSVVRQVDKSKLAAKVLLPLEDYLVSTGHVGYVDVNCIIDDAGNPWPLEFTCRLGWPTFNIQQSLLKDGEDHAQWLADLGAGRSSRPFKKNSVSVGVVLSIPDYPYSHLTRKEVCGIPIYISTPKIMSTVSMCEVAMGTAPVNSRSTVVTAPCWVTAGDYVLVALGTGETVRSARDAAYRTLKRIEIPNSPMYRTDIGNRLAKQLPMIQSHGFASGLTF